MTISITVPDVTFSKFVSKVALPYIEDAVSFQLYGGGQADSIQNRTLNPTANASAVGAPTYASNYATISNTNGFDTGFVLDTPFTHVFVGAIVSGGASPIGRAPGGEEFVNMIQVIVDGLRAWPNGVGDVAVGATPAEMAQFAMLGARWGGNNTRTNIFFRNGSSLAQSTRSTDLAKTYTPTTNLRVGACGAGAGSWKVAATAFYDRVLTDPELLEVYAYLKGLLASRGVTML